jgi:pyruvate/2-oxoglutarate/acetoin dehydrogenase E1 component
MTGGQVTVPLVVRTANGGGLGFGAQHSQAVENWALTIPGLKIAAPATPADDGCCSTSRAPLGAAPAPVGFSAAPPRS